MIAWFRQRRAAKRRRCSIEAESYGIFIGRRYCHTHNVVWDQGGRCPRQGREPGDPFFMSGYR